MNARLQPGETSAPIAEERRDQRTLTLFRAGAIRVGRHVGFCVIRNVSVGGAMIRTAVPLVVDAAVTLTLASGRDLPGRIRWQQADTGGIQFDTPIELRWVIDRHDGAPPELDVRRMPRIAIELPAHLTDAQGTRAVTTCDISTHGIRLACLGGAVTGHARLEVRGLPPIGLRILWSRDGEAGCVFDRPFDAAELTRWLAAIE